MRRHIRTATSLLALVVVALTMIATPAAAAHCDPQVIGSQATGQRISECLIDGHAVELDSVVVTGPVMLSRATVDGPFICRGCTFDTGLNLRDATVRGRVDLRGSIFGSGGLVIDAEGASFGHTMVLSTSDAISTATGDVVFSGAEFSRVARFERMIFNGEALFEGSEFGDDADFRGAAFQGSAAFTDARVGGDLDFMGARFAGNVRATGARIKGSFHAGANYKAEVRFSELDVGKAFRFNDARFTPTTPTNDPNCGQVVDLRDLSVGEFFVDTDDLDKVCGPAIKDQISELHEKNARDRGDLETANDVRFDRLWRQGSLVDHTFYGAISGYLVRWSYPALVLVGLLALMWGRRIVAGRRRHPGEKAPTSWVAGVATGFWDTWRNFWPVMSIDKDKPRSWLERFEAVAGWALFFIGLYALGNSLPVVKELINNFL